MEKRDQIDAQKKAKLHWRLARQHKLEGNTTLFNHHWEKYCEYSQLMMELFD